MTSMHQPIRWAFLLLLLVTGSCSSDDSDAGGSPGGTSGKGAGGASGGTGGSSGASSGTGGSAAPGGKSGTGGSSETGGADATGGSSPAAGKGGKAGAGAGGKSGTGGSAGEGGDPTGGTGGYLVPAPLVSRDKEVESSPDEGERAFDGEWGFSSTWRIECDTDEATEDGWVKINVGEGPTRLLFVWHTDSTPDYTIATEINFGAPTAYFIEVSATGEDADWTRVAEVTGEPDDVTYRSRAHSFDFTGMSYVRWTLTKLVSGQGQPNALIGEAEIHDISAGAEDTWAVVGLGASRSTYHGHTGLFPELIHEAHPDYYPALIDLAEAGGKAVDLVSEIDTLLELNSDFHFWILAYGMGDAENNQSPGEANFKESMQAVIDKLKDAGKVPLIPRLEKTTDSNHQNVGEFNAVIDELVAENGLPAAPDLYALFSEQPELLCMTGCEGGHEGIDFSPEGELAVNALWASVLDPLYAP
jgi:acyl-CoA thioesterase I